MKTTMTKEERSKLRELRIKGKEGLLKPDEMAFCTEMFEKYGCEEYDSVISEKEVFEITSLNPLKRR